MKKSELNSDPSFFQLVFRKKDRVFAFTFWETGEISCHYRLDTEESGAVLHKNMIQKILKRLYEE